MNCPWSNSVIPIAAIFSFRMMGLFMLIPVFTIFAPQLNGATPTLIGVALGSYGLSQGLLQIPFGILSDLYGRKIIISIGLLIFLVGSLLGAKTHSIYGMIIARMLQGGGAIGSVLIALLADLTSDDQRTKAMAVIGATIGISFSVAMVLSSSIANQFGGLSGIFYFTAILALSGLLLLHTSISTPTYEHNHINSKLALLKTVIFDKDLQRLNTGIFLQHTILTATFFVIPLLLQQFKQSNITQQWHFYLPLMLISFLLMLPLIIYAEKKQCAKFIFLSSIAMTSLTQLLLALCSNYLFILFVLMLVYLVSFNSLEASLPSLISKQANPNVKGTAIGVYSSSQFLGIFIGGLMAGLLFQYAGIDSIFIANSLLSFLWFIIALPMRQ